MIERAEIEIILRQAYQSRSRGDLDGIMHHFADDATFAIAGSAEDASIAMSVSGIAAVREVMADLIRQFDIIHPEIMTMIVEGDTAFVHWRMRVRSTATGREAETEIADVVQVVNGKIVSIRQFVDTALAKRLTS